MSILYHTGFDLGLTFAQMPEWVGGSPACAIFAGVGRTGSGFRSNSAGAFARLNLGSLGAATLIVGLAMRPLNVSGPANNNQAWLQFLGDGAATDHCRIRIHTNGSIDFCRGTGTVIAGPSTTGLVTSNTYAFWEFKVILHDTNGSIEVRKDGVTVLSATGLDTKNVGTASVIDTIHFVTPSGQVTDCDDLYVCDAVDSGIAGSPNNDFLGDCRTSVLLPSTDSTPEEWDLSTGSSSSALIDEATPNTTDYIFSDVSTEKTQVAMADLSDSDHAIYGVTLTAWAAKDDVGPAHFRQGLHSDATDANGVDHSLSTDYQRFQDRFEADPDGGVQWTPASVNAAEAFVEVRS